MGLGGAAELTRTARARIRRWRVAGLRGATARASTCAEPIADHRAELAQEVGETVLRASLFQFAERSPTKALFRHANRAGESLEHLLGVLPARVGRRRQLVAANDRVEAEFPTQARVFLALAIVGALAQPESEAWLVCAWSPGDPHERAEHTSLRQELGFDPIARSQELTSTSDTSRKDTKKVLERLAGSVAAAEEHFRRRSLGELEQAGTENGLADFLRELRPVIRNRLGAG